MIFNKHFFIYLLTIYIYIYTMFSYTCWYFYIFFLNIYSDFFPHFSISLFRIWALFCPVGFCLFAVFYWVLWVPCILWILTSLQIHGLQFSFSIPYVVFSFSCLLIVPFAVQKLVSVIQLNLPAFVLLPVFLVSYSWNHYQDQCHQVFSLFFFLGVLQFQVLHLHS